MTSAHRSAIVGAVLATACSLREVPRPPSAEVDALARSGYAAYHGGRYLEARRDLEAARSLEESDKNRGLYYANILQTLAEVDRVLGDSPQAERLLRDTLRIRKRLLPPGDPEIGRTLNNLGLTLKDPEEAEATLRSAIGNLETALGPHHVDVAMPLANLSTLLTRLHRCAEAETLARRSLAIREGQQSAATPEFSLSLVAVATAVACDPGRYAEAEPYYERATRGWEASLGASHPKLALALVDWARDAACAGRVDLASRLYARALQIQEASLPPDNPALARTRQLYAELERTRAHPQSPSGDDPPPAPSR